MADKAERKSIIAPYIDGLLAEKHANGYSYDSEELVLNRFDAYCVEHGLTTVRRRIFCTTDDSSASFSFL